ncbi:hypothetical protein RB195_009496 [Necator americanus]|uniref:Reverse transcriptase domain-containing protein n=1 Tax=Necator americanus TaxID=51031 RepID=A0ABR1CTJ6_NECAM
MRRTVDQCPADIVLAPSRCPLTNLEYADDVVIFAESSTKLQHVVNLVSKLAAAYGLRLRPDKCKQVWISSRPRRGIRVWNTNNQYGIATIGLILCKLSQKIGKVGQSCVQGRHTSAKMQVIASGDDISPPIKSSLDDLLLNSNAEAPDGVGGDDKGPAVVPDTDESDYDISDNEESENTWEDNAQKHDR